jgi:prepilin-type N-terminal cleavage/methylation domain-containing protein
MADHASIKKSDSNHGFSLFELLIVLVLLAMIAGVAAPATGRFLDNLSFRRQTAQLLAAMHYARLTAIGKGKPVKVTLSDQPGSVILSGAINENRSLELDDDGRIVFDPEVIVFSPAGQATPARLLSILGNRRQSYRLDPLSGRSMAE